MALQGHIHHITVLFCTCQTLHQPRSRRRHQDKPSHCCSTSYDDFQMQIQRIYEQEGICHTPHPGSPRANGKDLPFKYCKAIQEEDVCRVKLLCKQSFDSHPHTGNSLETTSHQVLPFMKHFWSTSSQGVTIFWQPQPGAGFRSKIPQGKLQ